MQTNCIRLQVQAEDDLLVQAQVLDDMQTMIMMK
jgi:hypothetical protein